MRRRNFIKTAAAGSVCALAGSAILQSAAAVQSKDEYKLKITVLKRTLNEEWNKEYRDGQAKICNKFKDGQEFIINSGWAAPEGFCHWAWADIRTYFHLVDAGTFKNSVCCCTDGVRPVFFKIEKVKA